MKKRPKTAQKVSEIGQSDRLRPFVSQDTPEAAETPVTSPVPSVPTVRPLVKTKKYTDPIEMEKAINKYFNDCDAEERPYTIEGLALACGFSCTETLRNYGQDEGYEAFHDLVKSAKLVVQKQRVEAMQNGKLNAIAGIFLLVNGHKTDYKREPGFDEESIGKVLQGFRYVPPVKNISDESGNG